MEVGKLQDIFWILMSAAMVMLMQGGFCFLESGMVRSKNSINVAIKNIADFCLSGILFWCVGFALMFGPGFSELSNNTYFLFGLSPTDNTWLIAFFLFQVTFCGTAATIISGAVAERTRFIAYLLGAALIATIIYPIFGHWAWNGAIQGKQTGWLNSQGFIDFAGSSVVHSIGGWVALAAIIIIGPRVGRFAKGAPPIQGYNIPMAALGVFLLWFGWFGFNGGSNLVFDKMVPIILLNTNLSAMLGGLTCMVLSWAHKGKPDVNHVLNGALAGLVSITASCYVVSPISSVAIGVIGGICYYTFCHFLIFLKIDDAVGAVSVHGISGAWGTIAVALFGKASVLGTGLSFWPQLEIQCKGVLVCFMLAFGVSFSVLWLVNRFYRLRVLKKEEVKGLNVAEHDATTENLDLLLAMDKQRKSSDFSKHVAVEPHTEVGQIAKEYNRVLDKVTFETDRSEDLLHNILPKPIAERLKEGKKPIAQSFEQVTVLFSDIVSFTQMTEKMGAEELVSMLNKIFSKFDKLCGELGLEKIKTIGDAYMVVGGLPKPHPAHATAIAEMALGMQKIIRQYNKKHKTKLQIRIGINTGPVMAGVIGVKKFVYDLWGDAVNVASRMESHGEADEIQVTETTYKRIKKKYTFEKRDVIEVKGKGKMRTYFLKGHKKS